MGMKTNSMTSEHPVTAAAATLCDLQTILDEATALLGRKDVEGACRLVKEAWERFGDSRLKPILLGLERVLKNRRPSGYEALGVQVFRSSDESVWLLPLQWHLR